MMVCIICSEFVRVQPNGQQAVDALENYNSVVQLLTDANELATQAQASVAQAQATLSTVTVADLQTQALQADSESRAVNDTVRQRELSGVGPTGRN